MFILKEFIHGGLIVDSIESIEVILKLFSRSSYCIVLKLGSSLEFASINLEFIIADTSVYSFKL